MGIEFNGDMKLNLNTSQLGFLKNPKVGGTNDSDIGKLLSSFGQKGINLKDDPLGQLVANAADINIEESPKIKAAKSELSGKVSSSGISYADAESKIKEIKDKYNGDEYKTEVPVDTGGLLVHKTMKKFDSSKLPEPARTEYQEAMEAKNEIEKNNAALVKKAGITPLDKEDIVSSGKDVKISGELLKAMGFEGVNLATEKQKAARAKMDEKVSSTGVKYKDAKAVLDELTDKYGKDKEYQSEFYALPTEHAVIRTHKAFDPYKLPEPDKSAYFEALQSVLEIEDANSALQAQTGLPAAKMPPQNYSNSFAQEELY